MYRQSETRAGNRRRPTRMRNASLPTQANICTSRKRRSPNEASVHASNQDTTPCATEAPATDTVARHPPRAPAVTRARYTQWEPRHQGNPPAPREQAQASQRRCARTGRTKQNERTEVCSTFFHYCVSLSHTNAGQQRYSSHKQQSPSPAAVKASNQHTTLRSHRTLCHRGTKYTDAAPIEGATGTDAARIQLISRRRGNPQAPVMEPRHGSARALGRNKQNGGSKPRTQSHTHTHIHIHLNRPGRPRQGG